MNFLQRMEHWGDTHHPKWVDIIRIALGLFLCFKGIQFLNNMGTMMNLMASTLSYSSLILIMISHYIIFAHLIGGLLLALGLLTRLACLFQIPVLIGAVFFVNLSGEILRPFSELALSIVVLLLLIYFLIAGNGPWSFNWFAEHEKVKSS